MQLTCSAFPHQGEIPAEHTCEGEDSAPPLEWSGSPPATKRFALIVDDPDAPDPKAPKRTYVHWVLYDLASSINTVGGAAGLPKGACEGTNDFGQRGYGGPCPPIGRHRYFFKLYALDTTLGDRGALKKAELEAAMKGHVLAQAELIGTYEKGSR